MSLQIPIPRADGDAFVELLVTLDNETFLFEMRWNVRLKAWFLNIYDSSGTVPQAVGVRLVPDWPLLRGTVDRKPPGFLVLRDTAKPIGQGDDPGLDDLGTRHLLGYVTEQEVIEIRSP